MTQIIHNLPKKPKVLTFADLPVGTIFTITHNGPNPRTFIKLGDMGKYSNKTRCISDGDWNDGAFTAEFTQFRVVTKMEFHYD